MQYSDKNNEFDIDLDLLKEESLRLEFQDKSKSESSNIQSRKADQWLKTNINSLQNKTRGQIEQKLIKDFNVTKNRAKDLYKKYRTAEMMKGGRRKVV